MKTMLRAALAALLTLVLAVPAFAAATTWPGSRIPFLDTSGDPMVGAQLSFYNCETTTPQVVYEDGDLSTPLDQPIEADARGMFPVIYLSPTPGCYRQKLLDADDATVFDDDNINVPQSATYVPPDAGDTSEELLFRTGMLEPYYGTSSPSGWVRCNGRTIGNAASGATERANADTEDLFEHLWTVDSSLTVSGGRGGSASGDFAANKTITLPDCRDRALAALATMGNSDAGLVADSYVDGGETTSTLGATAGVDDLTLSTGQLPSHTHTFSGTTDSSGAHTHTFPVYDSDSGGSGPADGTGVQTFSGTTASSGAHTHTFSGTTAATGSGAAINNMSPFIYVTILIKL